MLTLFGLILLNDSDRCVESMFLTFEDDFKLGGKPVALVFKKVLRSKKSRLNLNQQKNVHYAKGFKPAVQIHDGKHAD